MAVMDEFKKERETIKNAPFKKKVSYFWDYYKWHVIIPLVIIIVLGTFIYNQITNPETLLDGIFLNTNTIDASKLSDDLAHEFYKENEIDTKKYGINLNSTFLYEPNENLGNGNYGTAQALMAWVSSGTTDFISGDLDAMIELAYKGYLIDLRDFLSEAELEKYEPYLLYVDQSVADELSKALEKSYEEYDIDYPDCTKPEEMKEPFPVFIDMSQCEKVTNLYEGGGPIVFGVAAKCSHKDTLLQFLDYLME